MNVREAVARFRKRSPYAAIVKGLASTSEAVRVRAFEKLEALPVNQGDTYATTWAIDERTAQALVDVVGGLAFPPQPHDWNDPAHDLIFPLIQSPYPTLVPGLRAAYPRLPLHARCAVLAVLGAIATRAAAEAFVACIRDHGWPGRAYARVPHELRKLGPHADLLFPALFVGAGENLGGVLDAFVDMAARGVADPAKLDLAPLTPLVVAALRKQRDLAMWLDLAGYLTARELGPLIRPRLAHRDPKVATFAAIATLRRGGTVPSRILDRIAANHATRSMLFHKLHEVGAGARFPAKWRTWEAFAAAEMVEWLSYPSELGRAPAALEHMAVIAAHGKVVHVWRFRETAKRPWLAAISGPYVQRGRPRPLHGELTFSRFEKWDSATPEEHAEAVAKTLAEWRAEQR